MSWFARWIMGWPALENEQAGSAKATLAPPDEIQALERRGVRQLLIDRQRRAWEHDGRGGWHCRGKLGDMEEGHW